MNTTISLPLLALLGCTESTEEIVWLYDLQEPLVTFEQPIFTSSDVVVVSWVAVDDGEMILTWRVNGEYIQHEGASLSHEWFVRGDVVEVGVYVTEGTRRSNTVWLSTVIANSAPTGTLDLTATAINTTEAVVPTVSTFDQDLDQLSVEIFWTELNSGQTFEGDQLIAEQTLKNEQWLPTLRLKDGFDVVEITGDLIQIVDSPSTIVSVSITPLEPSLMDVLYPSIDTEDLDNDAVPIFYRWQTASGLITAPSLDGVTFQKGDAIVLEASLTEDFAQTVTSDPVTILNTPPEVYGVVFSDEEAFADSTVSCLVDGTYDVDGDTLQYEISWYLNGVYQQPTQQLNLSNAGAVYGDTLTCTVRVYDGEAFSEPQTNSMTVSNTPPTIADATLSDSHAYVNSSIACLPGITSDIDNQGTFRYQYQWTQNGESIVEPTGSYTSSMPQVNLAGNFAVGDEIQCAVAASDGVTFGDYVESNTLIVENRPPTASQVSITPVQVYIDSELSCRLLDYYDADLNEDVSTVQWFLNGALVHEEADWTVYDALTGTSLLSIGDQLTCQITPSDGIATLPPIAITSVVENKPPEVLVAYISPAQPASTHDAVIQTVYQDVDGDEVTLEYDWFQNGTLVSNEQILPYTSFARGDQLQARVTPNSNGMNGAAYLTDIVEVGNGYPDPATPVIEPIGPREGIDDLYCYSLTPPSDPDGDVTVHTYSWQVNGNWTMYTVDTIPATEIQAGDVWVCLITAVDAEGAERGAAAYTIIRRPEPLWTELYEFDPVIPVFTETVSDAVSQTFSMRDGEECWGQQDIWSSWGYTSFRSSTELEAVQATATVYSPDTRVELVFQGETFNTDGFEEYFSVNLMEQGTGLDANVEWGSWSMPTTASGDQQTLNFTAGFTLGQSFELRVETDSLLEEVTVLLDGNIVLQTDAIPFMDMTSTQFYLRSYRDNAPADVCWRDVFLYEGNP